MLLIAIMPSNAPRGHCTEMALPKRYCLDMAMQMNVSSRCAAACPLDLTDASGPAAKHAICPSKNKQHLLPYRLVWTPQSCRDGILSRYGKRGYRRSKQSLPQPQHRIVPLEKLSRMAMGLWCYQTSHHLPTATGKDCSCIELWLGAIRIVPFNALAILEVLAAGMLKLAPSLPDTWAEF